MKVEDVGLKFTKALIPIKKVTKIICHHPAHSTWDIHDIHKSHQNKGWIGIGYNYFITKDGRIQFGRGKHEGAHCQGYNDFTLGACFQGNFEVDEMTDAQVKAGGWIIAQLVREYGLDINDVIGHNKVAATLCPGKNFRMDDLKNEVLAVLNPKAAISVAAASDTQPKQYFYLTTGEFPTEEDAEDTLKALKQAYKWEIRREGKRIVTGTWTDAGIAQKMKDEWKQTFGWWVYIGIR